MSLGRHLEIVKQVGSPANLEATYHVSGFQGTHGIGHTRLSTESRVDLSHSQPFWGHGYPDLAVAHNGHITNYHQLRRRYEQRGIRFYTENDSEIIAIYLAGQLSAGHTLEQAFECMQRDLDGSFSCVVATASQLGFVKDQFALKPLLYAETPMTSSPSPPKKSLSAARSPAITPCGKRRPRSRAYGGSSVRRAEHPRNQLRDQSVYPCRGKADYVLRIPADATTWASPFSNPAHIRIEGSAGYYCGGLADGSTVEITGSAGWGLAESMLNGTAIVHGSAGNGAGAAIRGGAVIIHGDAAARAGVSMKGGLVLIGGNCGYMAGIHGPKGIADRLRRYRRCFRRFHVRYGLLRWRKDQRAWEPMPSLKT